MTAYFCPSRYMTQKQTVTGRRTLKDIEGDVITICYDNFEHAEKIFDGYDIEKVREEKKKVFLDWLEEFAEA